MGQLDRITQQPDVMGGKACIRGMRVTVGMVVGQIGAGHSIDDVLADYPYLEREDIMQALRCAALRGGPTNARSCCLPHEAVGGLNLSSRWIRVLADAGIEATHQSALGANNAPDLEQRFAMVSSLVGDFAVLVQAPGILDRVSQLRYTCFCGI